MPLTDSVLTQVKIFHEEMNFMKYFDLTECTIMNMSTVLCQYFDITDCTYSKGWLTKFKNHYGIKISGEKAPADTENDELFANEFINSEKLSLEQICNADETGVFWNMYHKISWRPLQKRLHLKCGEVVINADDIIKVFHCDENAPKISKLTDGKICSMVLNSENTTTDSEESDREVIEISIDKCICGSICVISVFKTLFVKNRVEEIQSLTNSNKWAHCPVKENPADIIYRVFGPWTWLKILCGAMDHLA
ncbi:Jerky protein-like protein, partial [Stegodyphus mimosarum]